VTNIIVESNVTGVFRAREGCSVTLQNELSWQMVAAPSSGRYYEQCDHACGRQHVNQGVYS
jgi:hypothetical protein